MWRNINRAKNKEVLHYSVQVKMAQRKQGEEMKVLHLNLKKEYFDEIKNGNKKFEFRLCNSYWAHRLVGVQYDEVHFKCGYPKRDDNDKIIVRRYIGYEIQYINHKHFGSDTVKAFAIAIE